MAEPVIIHRRWRNTIYRTRVHDRTISLPLCCYFQHARSRYISGSPDVMAPLTLVRLVWWVEPPHRRVGCVDVLKSTHRAVEDHRNGPCYRIREIVPSFEFYRGSDFGQRFRLIQAVMDNATQRRGKNSRPPAIRQIRLTLSQPKFLSLSHFR